MPKYFMFVFAIVVLSGVAGYIVWNGQKPKDNPTVLSEQTISTPTPLPTLTITDTPEPTLISTTQPVQTIQETQKGKFPMTEQPAMQISPDKKYTAVIHTTSGDITVELNAKGTPITVNNFVFLARNSFYNNSIFHRVIKGFMIQGGDPTGTGMGGPGYKFKDEPFTGEYTRGTIAMANAGPNTNGSQFFIMHADAGLPKNYVIFGKVVKGIETVDVIATSPVSMSDSGENSKPVTPVKIQSVDITEQ